MDIHTRTKSLVEFINPNGAKSSYTYYSNGLRRISNNIQYYYDGDNVIIETVNGNLSATNNWGINPIARQKDGATLYYLYNGHADVVALVDAAGNDRNEVGGRCDSGTPKGLFRKMWNWDKNKFMKLGIKINYHTEVEAEAISNGKIGHVLTDHTYGRMNTTINKMMEKGLSGSAEKY